MLDLYCAALLSLKFIWYNLRIAGRSSEVEALEETPTKENSIILYLIYTAA
jgi:hypothetical protein